MKIASPSPTHDNVYLDGEEKKAIRRVLFEARCGVAILGAILLAHFFGFY
jgi:hypothetical protein